MGKASTRAQNRYIAKAYDRINLTVPKGKKETIQAHAEAQGESVNGFINRAIDHQISHDRDKGPSEVAQGPQEYRDIFLHPDTLTAAQEAAEAAGEDLPTFLDRAIEETADRDVLPKEVIFGRAVDVVAEHYEVSCWDVLKELEGLKREGGEANE